MRPLVIVGIIILGLGVFALLSGGSFTSQRDVLKVGDVEITANEQTSVPPWVGGAAILLGAGLIVAGVRKRA